MKIRILKIFTLFFICFLLFAKIDVYSQSKEENILLEDGNTPFQKMLGDTLKNKKQQTAPQVMPGEYSQRYSKMQDSAYTGALKLKIPIGSRFANDIRQFLPKNSKSNELINEKSLAEIIKENLDLPAKFFMPSAVEMTMHDYNIMQSQYIPFVQTNKIGGLKVSMGAIAMFLGLIEDTSPNITYKIDETSEVEVVIYSVQAVVIASIYKGVQLPGSYKLVWNFRDELGRIQPSGDYIAEVRIGKERFARKRIYIP
jgi:hypothetical protein